MQTLTQDVQLVDAKDALEHDLVEARRDVVKRRSSQLPPRLDGVAQTPHKHFLFAYWLPEVLISQRFVYGHVLKLGKYSQACLQTHAIIHTFYHFSFIIYPSHKL